MMCKTPAGVPAGVCCLKFKFQLCIRIRKLLAQQRLLKFIDAANRRKFTITNDKLQMNGMGFAHDFKSFSQKTPQFVICNFEL